MRRLCCLLLRIEDLRVDLVVAVECGGDVAWSDSLELRVFSGCWGRRLRSRGTVGGGANQRSFENSTPDGSSERDLYGCVGLHIEYGGDSRCVPWGYRFKRARKRLYSAL